VGKLVRDVKGEAKVYIGKGHLWAREGYEILIG